MWFYFNRVEGVTIKSILIYFVDISVHQTNNTIPNTHDTWYLSKQIYHPPKENPDPPPCEPDWPGIPKPFWLSEPDPLLLSDPELLPSDPEP